MAYPDWVLKHKIKGTYVQIRGGKYYLYRGHSERVPDKSYPVLKFDEYLGQITEQEGLITPKPPVRPGVSVYCYGPYLLIEYFARTILAKLRAEQGLSAEQISILAQLKLVHGHWNKHLYLGSWLSLQYPGLKIPEAVSETQLFSIDRVINKITDKLSGVSAGKMQQVIDLARRVSVVEVNNQWVISRIPEELKEINEVYKILWEVNAYGKRD